MSENQFQKHYIRLISLYLEGKADKEQIDRLERLVKLTPQNKSLYQRMKNIHEVAKPGIDPDQIDTHAAFARMSERMLKNKFPSDQDKKIVPHKKFDAFAFFQKIAAILLLPLSVSSVWLWIELQNKPKEVITQHELTAPYGVNSHTILPDGSRVWINSGSKLVYASDFGRTDQRRLSLSGEGFFEVKTDPEHPFVVDVNGLEVMAKGTAFNIHAYDEDRISVVLVNGIVEVAGKDKKMTMDPGQLLTVRTDQEWALENTDPYVWSCWKDGVIAFRDHKLSSVFERLEEIYNVEFEVVDQSIKEYIYYATFKGESISDIIDLLQMSAPIFFVEKTQPDDGSNHFRQKKFCVFKK
ncbi:MAG: FecR family protein [Bacteroidales bacterium]